MRGDEKSSARLKPKRDTAAVSKYTENWRGTKGREETRVKKSRFSQRTNENKAAVN